MGDTKLTKRFLLAHGFIPTSDTTLYLPVSINNKPHLLIVDFETQGLHLASEETKTETATFNSKPLTEERLKSLYNGITGEVLEEKINIHCTEKELLDLGFVETNGKYMLAIPNPEKSSVLLHIIVNLDKNFAYIALQFTVEDLIRIKVIDKNIISLQRIDDLYIGLTNERLTKQI